MKILIYFMHPHGYLSVLRNERMSNRADGL